MRRVMNCMGRYYPMWYTGIALGIVIGLIYAHAAIVANADDRRDDVLNGKVKCIKYNATINKFDLDCAFTWSDGAQRGIQLDDYVTLHKNEEFDGHDFEIQPHEEVLGLFDIDDTNITSIKDAPFIHNLHIRGGHLLQDDAGFIIRKNARFYHVDSCSIDGEMWQMQGTGSGTGGIAGGMNARDGGEIVITNCTSAGEPMFSKGAGGILGRNAGQNGGTVNITNCLSTKAIGSADQAGGIVGSHAGIDGGQVYIKNSHFRGRINGQAAGGICGKDAGKDDGKVFISGSSSEGTIWSSASRSGGICGEKAGSNGGQVHVSMCYFDGSIQGEDSGGFFGDNAGDGSGEVFVWNSYSRGTVSAYRAGGMFGGDSNNTAKIEIHDSYASGKLDANYAGSIFGWSSGEERTKVDHTVYRENICGNDDAGFCNPWKNATSNNLTDITGKLYCGPQGRCWSSDVWVIAANETYPVLQSVSSSSPPSRGSRSPFPTISLFASNSPSTSTSFTASPYPSVYSSRLASSPTPTCFVSNSPSASSLFTFTPSPSPSPSSSGLASSLTSTQVTETVSVSMKDGTVSASQRLPPKSPSGSPDPSDQANSFSPASSGTSSQSPSSELKFRMEVPCQHPARAVVVSDDEQEWISTLENPN